VAGGGRNERHGGHETGDRGWAVLKGLHEQSVRPSSALVKAAVDLARYPRYLHQSLPANRAGSRIKVKSAPLGRFGRNGLCGWNIGPELRRAA